MHRNKVLQTFQVHFAGGSYQPNETLDFNVMSFNQIHISENNSSVLKRYRVDKRYAKESDYFLIGISRLSSFQKFEKLSFLPRNQ